MATRYTIEDMQKYAAYKGGRCLSKEYVNYFTKLEWQCEKGHKWEADIQIIKQGGWCRQCIKEQRNEEILQELKEAAKKKGGECLSPKYMGWHNKLKWRCANGHEWEAVAYHIRNGNSWCPHCAGKARLTLEQMRETARKRGGRCLSTEYVNISTKMLWQCEKGHKWNATPRKIRSGQWCPHKKCRYERTAQKLRKDINELKELAENRGGKLLSRKYKNRRTKLKWQCAKGHKWMADASNVTFGPTWCPVCSRKLMGRKKKNGRKKKQWG